MSLWITNTFHESINGRARHRLRIALLAVLLTVGFAFSVSAEDNSSKKKSHPYLYFRGGELPQLRKRFRNPPQSWYLKLLRREAETNGNSQKADDAALQLWAYLLLDRKKYRKNYLQWVKNEWGRTDFSYEWIGFKVCWLAMGYDALYPELSARHKKKMKSYLQRALDAHRAKMDDWLYDNPSNTVPAQAGAMGMAALALYHESARARELAHETRKKLMGFARDTFSPDGGYIEGSLYWSFGVSFYLGFAHADHNTTGNDRLLTASNLKQQYRFVETILGGDGQFMTYNDTQPWLNALPVCVDLGRRYKNDLLLWLADRMAGIQSGEIDAPGVHVGNNYKPWTWVMMTQSDSGPERKGKRDFPGVPVLSVLDTMEWGVMRSSGEYRPELVVGVKGSGGTLSHHAQKDLGSFVLYAGGETLLFDPGYFNGKPESHTLPLIHGKGPGTSGSRITKTWKNETWRSMTINSSKTYAEVARRVRRILVMHRTRGVVVLDDILPGKGPVGLEDLTGSAPPKPPGGSSAKKIPVTAQYQAAHRATVDAETGVATVVAPDARLHLWTFGPELYLDVNKRNFGRSWLFKKRADQGDYAWHTLSGKYASNPDNPLVTVLIPADQKTDPGAPKYRREGNTIVVRLPGARPVRFRKTTDVDGNGETKEAKWRFVRPDSDGSKAKR